ncbi:hypothetical protein V1291_000242 [Nitrobacteraceae bacterium AZCC 1564]
MAPKKQSGGATGGRSTPAKAKVKSPKRKRMADPTRDAPFRIDVANDGDLVLIRHDLSEDEIKEQADRAKTK